MESNFYLSQGIVIIAKMAGILRSFTSTDTQTIIAGFDTEAGISVYGLPFVIAVCSHCNWCWKPLMLVKTSALWMSCISTAGCYVSGMERGEAEHWTLDGKSEQLAWLLPCRGREKEQGKEAQEGKSALCATLLSCCSPSVDVTMEKWEKGEERSRIFLAAEAKKSPKAPEGLRQSWTLRNNWNNLALSQLLFLSVFFLFLLFFNLLISSLSLISVLFSLFLLPSTLYIFFLSVTKLPFLRLVYVQCSLL